MYLALARKYRPQRFSDLIGQPHVTQTMQNAIRLDKVYPALIFSGMKGVGKTSAARILAKALNCEKGPAEEPCNECSFCREITEDRSSDYLEIDGASNNGVNEVRSLRETVRYKPIKNRLRMVVIDEVHMLSTAAWNALLKTIEEPPEHTVFVMATTDFHKIPATIVSRCQHFEFKRIPLEIIQQVLLEICRKESVEISEYALFLVSRSAEGSLRDAKKILDQAIAISKGKIRDEDVIEILGVVDEEIMLRLVQSILQPDRRALVIEIERLVEKGVDLRFFYSEFMKFLRDLLVLRAVPEGANLCSLNPEIIPKARETIDELAESQLLRYLNAVKESEQAIRFSENPRITLELLFLKMSHFSQIVPIEEALKGLSLVPPHAEKKAEPPKNTVKTPPDDPDQHDLRGELLRLVEAEKPRLASLLAMADWRIKDDFLQVEVSAGANGRAMIVESESFLNSSLASLGGKKKLLKFVFKENQSAENQKKTMEKLRADKKIGSLTDKIKGKLVTVETIEDGDYG